MIGRAGIRAKMFLMVSLVLVLTVGTTVSFEWVNFNREYSTVLGRELEAQSYGVKEQLTKLLDLEIPLGNIYGFDENLLRLVEQYPNLEYAAVLDRSGEKVFASGEGILGERLEDVEARELMKRGERGVVWWNEYYLVLNPVEAEDGEVVAYMVLVTSSGTVQSRTASVMLLSLGVAGVGVLGGLVLVWVVVNAWITRPLRKMEKTSMSIAEGNLGERMEITSRDEIGRVANAFNMMAAKLSELYIGMEEKVKEKTGELNNRLKELEEKRMVEDETKKAMMNLLEDARKLEEDLKHEKEGVELKVKERTAELEKAKDQISQGWRQMQQEKARLNAAIESLPLGMVIIDLNHEVVESNETILGVLALQVELTSEVLEKSLMKMGLVLKELCPHCRGDKQLYEKGEVEYGEKFLRVFSVPVLSEQELIGAAIVVEDITEAKQLERSRDEFFSVASHELRTPLTAIRGNSMLMKDYYPEIQNNAELSQMVDDVHTASIRLIMIVNDFLDASRLELGKVKFEMGVFDLGEVVKKALAEVRANVKEKKIEILFEVSRQGEFWVKADQARVMQVVINLMGNAVKFTEEGWVKLWLEEGQGVVRMKITDTGPGMDKETQELLFNKFKQGRMRGYARDVSSGTGMGLYISRLLMEQMGGRAYLAWTEVGKGSMFVAEFLVGDPNQQGQTMQVGAQSGGVSEAERAENLVPGEKMGNNSQIEAGREKGAGGVGGAGGNK